MDNEDDGRIQSLEQLVEELRTGYNELLEQTEKAVDRFENENSELKREIASLKEKLENKTSEEEEDDESGEPEFPEAEDTEDPKNLDPDDYITTAIPTCGTAPSPADRQSSLEWSPDYHATMQLHEFDDAPSVGRVELAAAVTTTSSGSSVTLKLVDPDGHTAAEDSSAKWMVPLRQSDGSGKVLHWARIGNAVSFNVGSTVEVPCPPTISGAISGNGVVVTVQNYGRSGQDCVPTTSDSVYIPLTSGITRTVITGAELTSGGLVLTREKHTVLAWTTENPVTLSGTTCEEGGTS